MLIKCKSAKGNFQFFDNQLMERELELSGDSFSGKVRELRAIYSCCCCYTGGFPGSFLVICWKIIIVDWIFGIVLKLSFQTEIGDVRQQTISFDQSFELINQ